MPYVVHSYYIVLGMSAKTYFKSMIVETSLLRPPYRPGKSRLTTDVVSIGRSKGMVWSLLGSNVGHLNTLSGVVLLDRFYCTVKGRALDRKAIKGGQNKSE